MAGTYNCKSTSTEFLDLDFTVTTEGSKANTLNNKTQENYTCGARDPEDGVTIITCDTIQLIITNQQIDIEGGNTAYEDINGMRSFLKCE